MQLYPQPPFTAVAGYEVRQAQVLHNHPIHTCGIQGIHILHSLRHLCGEDEYIHGHIGTHPALMQKRHQGTQIFTGKVIGTHTGIELIKPEVDGICPVCHGGTHAIPVARRG